MAWDKATRFFYPLMHQYVLECMIMNISVKRKKKPDHFLNAC